MRRILLLLLVAAVAIYAGCTQSTTESAQPEKAQVEEKTQPAQESAPAQEAPQQETQQAPAQEAPQAQQAALHGVGTCDSCHDAPTLDDMRAGKHANAFRKQPDIHKGLCKNCHNVEQDCSKCHAVPDIVEK